jgi:hypothetical protein
MNMLQIFKVGDEIQGYCNGFFGRDDYEDKTVVSVRPKYVLFEYADGTATVLNGNDHVPTTEEVTRWKLPYDEQPI